MAEDNAPEEGQETEATIPLPADVGATVSQVWGSVLAGDETVEMTIKAPRQVSPDDETLRLPTSARRTAPTAGQRTAPTAGQRTAPTAGRRTAPTAAVGEALDEGPLGGLDDYDIRGTLGEGGIGIVYDAHQKSLDRDVALKVLKETKGPARGIVETAFASEAIVTGDLDHPNIVPIHVLGRDSRGRTFYTMKKVSGQSWRSRINMMSLDQNLEILLRVSDAMAFAHSRGIIHRDLKPENVMIGEYGEVLILDWGLAASVDPGSKIEKHGGTIPFGGTPAYMAPEMAINRPEMVGRHSDIYLLGGILYRIVAKKPPHYATSAIKCLEAAARNEIQHTPKTGELIDVAMKAMSMAPADRYQTVEDFQEAIREYRAHAESIQLAAEAAAMGKAAEKAADYDSFARALHGFEAALTLWEENEDARQGRDETALDYARCAFRKEDYDLALSLLDPESDAHSSLRRRIEEARADRHRRTRAVRRLKVGVSALAAVLLMSLTVGFFWIRAERDTALREGYRAKIGLAAKKIEDLRFDKAEELLASCPPSLRHWEWGRLLYLCRRADVTFRGHSGQVEALALGPEGKRAASGDWTGEIKIWEVETGRELVTLKGHKDVVASMAFSPEGKTLASASDDGTVRLWDAATGREKLSLEGHEGEVWCVAFSPEGRSLASCGQDGSVRFWDPATGDETFTIKGDWGSVTSLAFSADGRRLAWCSGDLGKPGRIRVRDLDTQIETWSFVGHTDRIDCVAFSPDGEMVASGSWDNTVKLWNPADGTAIGQITGHSGPVHCLAFSPDGSWLASGSDDGTVRRWDLRGAAAAGTFKGHSAAVSRLAISPDGQRIVSSSVDGTVKVWDSERGGRTALVLGGHEQLVSSVAFSPDGGKLASAGNDGTIRLWDPDADGEGTVRVETAFRISSLAFSPDGKLIASGNGDHTIGLWDAETGERRAMLRGHEDLPRDIAFSPDGARLASAGFDGTIRLWDPKAGRELAVLTGHDGPVQSVAFSPDGARLASVGRDNAVRLWDVETGRNTATLTGHTHWVRCVAFSPDGRLIASAGDDNLIKLWDADTGAELANLKGHVKWVKSLAFSPDGKRLVSAGDDGIIRVWDTKAGLELVSLPGGGAWLWSVVFSPDGRRVAFGGGDGIVRVWDALDWEQ